MVCAAEAAQVERLACPAPFVTALARDRTGAVWAGTEDRGVFRLSPKMDEWRGFTMRSGFADDNVYAIAEDREGRIWCGTLNHGVSVFNGETWRTYDVTNGPLGERIFSIACSPKEGDVWIATSRGLARYSVEDNTWSHITRMDRMPAEQAESLAFTAQGDLIVGLQCGGIATAQASRHYAKWDHILAPWYSDKSQFNPHTLQPEGKGLPSNLINDVLVAKDGTVWVATVAGVAWRAPRSSTWQFLRGKDYTARVKGIYGGPPGRWREPPQAVEGRLLPEDYVACLAEGMDGSIWMGFREQGCAAFNPKTLTCNEWFKPGTKEQGVDTLASGYVRRLLPLPDGRILAGCYGGGLALITPSAAMSTVGDSSHPPAAVPTGIAFPAPATIPTDDQMASLTKQLSALRSTPAKAKTAVYLGEDWTTQGDCTLRYGRRYSMFCAMNAPIDNCRTAIDYGNYDISGRLGPTASTNDGLRHWIQWIKTDNPRVLFFRGWGHRNQAEWDDHGEAYPRAQDGPDVWIAVKVMPPGAHRLSLYFYNKDGHDGANRCRDYLVEVREYQSPLPERAIFNNSEARNMGYPNWERSMDMTNALPRKVLARARVKDFCGGVYKSFTVQGPGTFYVRIARHGSLNAIVSGVFLDTIPELRENPEKPSPIINMLYGNVLYESPDPGDAGKRPDWVAAATLWEKAQDICRFAGGTETYLPVRLLAYRQALARNAPENLLGNWRWNLGIWTKEDRKVFADKMVEIWDGMQEQSAYERSANFRPYSPNVIPFTVPECIAMKNNNVDWKAYIPPGKPYKTEVTTNRFPVLYALFGTTNVTKDTKLLTTLGKMQTDEERQPSTDANPRVRALAPITNALSAAERTGRVTEDVFQEMDALVMPLIRLPLDSIEQETENLNVLVRYLNLLLANGQTEVRFIWFHTNARLKSLKAKNEMFLYNDFLQKIQSLPLPEKERKEIAELVNSRRTP